ncbi:hypothetical protein ACFC1B_07030 [Streptomyces xiamenensis]|uniref:hypothetical protein n=1 Tax=Streptomyces xiamenensis TaxID=408015 RepID=UPI0035E2B11F
MSPQHTTAGWARAFDTSLRATAKDRALEAARRFLAASFPEPLSISRGSASIRFPVHDNGIVKPQLHVRELPDAKWDRIEAAIAELPGAYELAGTALISDQLTDPALTGGIAIVPTPKDISYACTCTLARGIPCTHTLALGLLLIDRLKGTPAALFKLRGRRHQALKDRLRAAVSTRPATTLPAPPAQPMPSQRPMQPSAPRPPAPAPVESVPIPPPVDLDLAASQPVLDQYLVPPPPPLPDAQAASALTTDTAHRAAALLASRSSPRPTSTGADITRFLAEPHGAPYRDAAMAHLGLDLVSMSHLTLAHTHGGPAGATTYLEPLPMDHDVLTQAQADIQPLRPAPTAPIECRDNRITDAAAGIQLRYGPDGRWYPYRARYGNWQPTSGPSVHAAKAYRAARSAGHPTRRQ